MARRDRCCLKQLHAITDSIKRLPLLISSLVDLALLREVDRLALEDVEQRLRALKDLHVEAAAGGIEVMADDGGCVSQSQ